MTSGYVNGTGTAARFNQPRGFCRVGTDTYVADSGNHCIRKIDSAGVVTTFAGAAPSSGLGTSGHLDATGTAARFWYPSDVCANENGTILFVADTFNRVIKKIVISTGVVTTIIGVPLSAGNVDGATPLLGEISSIAVSNESIGAYVIYALDTYNRVIRGFCINGSSLNSYTIAGSATSPAATIDGDLATGRFNSPRKIIYRGSSYYTGNPVYGGNASVFNTTLFITDGSNIRNWTGSTYWNGSAGVLSTPVTSALNFTQMSSPVNLARPEGLFLYGGSSLVTDSATGVLLNFSTNQCVAGRPNSLGATDGIGVSRLYNPTDVIAVDDYNGYVIDNNSVRKYNLSEAMLSPSVSFSIANPSSFISGDTRTLSATSTSSNPITFTSDSVLVADVSGTTLTAIKGGTARINASSASDRDYNAASSYVDIAITNPTPVISNLTASGEVGAPFSYQITATQNPLSFSAGPLPTGLAMYATPAGRITGTPTTAGVTSVPISVTSALGASATATLVITITGASGRITSSLVSTAPVGVVYSYQITANGTPTSFNATGLPSGLTVNTTTGLITGTPLSETTANVTLSATQGGATETAIMILRVTDTSIPLEFTVTQNKAAANGASSPWVTATKQGSLITVVVNRAPSVGLETGEVKCATIALSTPGSGRALPWQADVDLIRYVPPPLLTVSPAGPVDLAYNATSAGLSATIANASAAALAVSISGSNAKFDNGSTSKTFSANTSFSIGIVVTGPGEFSVNLSVASLGLSKTVEFSVGAQAITMTLAEVSAQYSTTASPRVACSGGSGNNTANNCLAIIKYGDIAKMELNSSSNLWTGTTAKATISKNSDVGNGGDIDFSSPQQGLTSTGNFKSIFDVRGVYPGSIGISATLGAEGRISAGTATATVQVNKATLGASCVEGSKSGSIEDDPNNSECPGGFYRQFNGLMSFGGGGIYDLSLRHKRCGADILVPNTITCVAFMTAPNGEALPSGTPTGYITSTEVGSGAVPRMIPQFATMHDMYADLGKLIEFPLSSVGTSAVSLHAFFNRFEAFKTQADFPIGGWDCFGTAGGAHMANVIDQEYFHGVPSWQGNADHYLSNITGATTRWYNSLHNFGTESDPEMFWAAWRNFSSLYPTTGRISLYVLPEMPYLGATLGDYFNLSGSVRSLSWIEGTSFDVPKNTTNRFYGTSSLGVDYFPAGQPRSFRRIAEISFTARVGSVTITNPGSGYTSNPTVTFSGGGGSGAGGFAARGGGDAVIAVSVTSGGSGYTSAPTVSFSGGGGSGATGTVELIFSGIANNTP